MELRNEAPARVPASASTAVAGVDPTTELLEVALHLPPDATPVEVLVDGAPAPVQTSTDRGWDVTWVPMAVPRGAVVVVRAVLGGPAVLVTRVQTQQAQVSAPGCG